MAASQKQQLPKIIVVVGPTASGKTALAIALAKRFNGEIISADSRQVYRGMNIGTAKSQRDHARGANPKSEARNSKQQRKEIFISGGIAHHLVDIKDPDQEYTVAQFKNDAIRAIGRIVAAGKLPILVGGTGLYVDAIVQNLDIPPVKPNKKLRAKLEKEIARRGLASVFKKLVALDPEAAYIVDSHNPQRVVRALEVALMTGKPFSAQRKRGEALFDCLELGIAQPAEVLKKRIRKRTLQMLQNGLVAEVKRLIKKFGAAPKPFDAIGYREIIACLKGGITLAQAKDLINKNTRRYAKRQLTWFKRNKNIRWISGIAEAKRLVAESLLLHTVTAHWA